MHIINSPVKERLADGQIEMIKYQPDRIEMIVTVGGEAFMIMGSTWSPY